MIVNDNSGSSILDIRRGGADLSRRQLEYTMYGLSFREYLLLAHGIEMPVYTLEDVVAQRVEFPVGEHRPIALFKEYMKGGYYPFFLQRDRLIPRSGRFRLVSSAYQDETKR